MKILKADPAKNITVFVLESITDPEERRACARSILLDKQLGAEQVGFVIPPSSADSLWRLQMAGGEFCGNASRSFGLYVARQKGLRGSASVSVSVSGAEKPVLVDVDIDKNLAKAEMPKPLSVESLGFRGQSYGMVVFEGITHVIAPDTEPGEGISFQIKKAAEKKHAEKFPSALGVMFFSAKNNFMVPVVHVGTVDTVIFESSCGSGSAALGAWLSRDQSDGIFQYLINQPGGVIETEVVKQNGEITRITIGGRIELGEVEEFPFTRGK